MYTAVVLDEKSQAKLKTAFGSNLLDGWTIICHHMTTNLGPANEEVKPFLGQTVDLTVKTLANDDKVIAVGVECVVPSTNTHKHITVGVNKFTGGKPKMSNDLKDWLPIMPIQLRGTVMEVVL